MFNTYRIECIHPITSLATCIISNTHSVSDISHVSYLRLRTTGLALGNCSTDVSRPCQRNSFAQAEKRQCERGEKRHTISSQTHRTLFHAHTFELTRNESFKEAVAISNNGEASFKGQEEDPNDTAEVRDWPGNEEENDPCRTKKNKSNRHRIETRREFCSNYIDKDIYSIVSS